MLNFMKGSFSRHWQPAGGSGGGKDTQVLAVAALIGEKTVSVKLPSTWRTKSAMRRCSCDMTAPCCPAPPALRPGMREVPGSILAAAHVTDKLSNRTASPTNGIAICSRSACSGENVFTYPPYSAELATELIDHLRNIAPYVIIDCGSAIATDILSAVALMEADSVLRLVNCDLKSVSYLSSQLPLLRDNKWDADKQYRVASNVKPHEASEHIEQVLGNVAFKIPHSGELESQALAGDLFRDLALKESRGFRKEIEKISREVFGV